MRPLRIGIVANTTWNISNFRLNVIARLLEQDYSIYVIAPVDEFIGYKKLYPSIRHIPLKMLHRGSEKPWKDVLLLMELRRKYRRLGLDAVLHYAHKANLYGTIAAKSLGIPSISVVTGLGYPFLHSGMVQKIVSKLYQITAPMHQKLIFENEDDRILFIKEGLAQVDNSVSIKGCGVSITHFQPTKISRNGTTRFTFIGRLLYDKGIKEFVNAAKHLRQMGIKARFTIAGGFDKANPSSVDLEQLNEWINLGIIDYKGHVRDVREIISESDCIVLPSYREAIARSLTEAMAMGRPVIATNTAGCKEAVADGETGYLIPIKDVAALEDAMVKIVEMSDQLLEEMGKRGREKAETEFSDTTIANQIVEFVNEIFT